MLGLGFTMLMIVGYCVKAMTDVTTDSNADSVVILAVSTVLGTENSTPVGSVMGGTTIYMKVQGLDQTASNNAVYIGKYPCLISDKGVNGLFMNCKTTKSDDNDNNLNNLQIVVKVAGKGDSVCTFSSTYCYFTYSWYYTPELYYVTPRSNYPRKLSYWRAKWAVTSNLVASMDGQFMGANRCDRFSIQDNYSDNINFWDDIVVCQVSGEVEAGYYPYKISTRSGYQKNDVGVSQKKVLIKETYDSKIIPLITSINTNFASPKGQILQIHGYGFSSVASHNKVSISGQSETIQVISSTPNQIIAQIPPLSSLPTIDNLSDQIFIQGSGLLYTRYDLSGLGGVNGNCAGFRTQIINNPSSLISRIQTDGIYPEPDVQNTFGSNYGQYFRGFLKAPITGKYKFYVASDDCAQFYIQTTKTLDITRADNPLTSNSWNPYRNYWYEQTLDATSKSISNDIQLNENEYYFIEVFHTNGAGTGYLTLSMEVENTSGVRQSNSLNSIYSISTSYQPIKEVIEFMLYNTAGNTLLQGTYQLQFTYGVKSTPQVGLYYNYVTQKLSLTSTVGTIESAIERCGGNYLVTVTASKLDNNGQILSDDVQSFAGYKYTITFDSYRFGDYRALPNLISQLTGSVQQNIQSIQEPSDPISGTFQLKMIISDEEHYFQVSNNNYDLPFDVTSTILADNVERITGTRPFVWTQGRAYDGWTWFIKLRSSVNAVIEGSGGKLASGSGLVGIEVVKPVPDSDNLLFEPIPNELLFTFSNTPQIQVTTNDILSGCEGLNVCDFTLSDNRTPTLTQFTVQNQLLSLTLQTGIGLPKISMTDLAITYAGAECSNIQSTSQSSPYSITCNLEQFDNKNIEEAGENIIPKVHNANIGYSIIDNSIIGNNIDLSIQSVTPNQVSPDGGATLIIQGSGFPKNLNRLYTLKIGNKEIIPKSINNKQIIVICPAIDSGEITLQFNGLTASASITVDNTKKIEVTSLEFNQLSPTYRGLFNIQGKNFGEIINDVQVTLVGSTKSYNAKVVTVTDTSVQVYLRGGMPGTYSLVVTRSSYGSSPVIGTNNKLKYIIPVSKVTLEDDSQPAKGSEAGGSVIKITGENFIKDETLVFVGNAVNWICVIDEERFTSTTIYCTVPAKNQYYQSTPQKVIVTVDVILESTCIATDPLDCTFTFDNAITPTIDEYPENAVPSSGQRLLTIDDHLKEDYHKQIIRKRYLWTDESKNKGVNHILNHGQSNRRDMLSSLDLVVTKVKAYNPGDIETLTGTLLTNKVSILLIGPITLTIDTQLNGNLFTYTIPALPQGQYITYVKTENGYADKIWLTEIGFKISSMSTAVIGGQILHIYGVGFNQDKSPTVKAGSTICTNVKVISSTEITCRLPRQSVTGVIFTVSQLSFESNSVIPLKDTYWIAITQQNKAPIFTGVTVNGANTYDNTKKAYTATSGNVVLVITGSRLTATSLKVTLEYQDNIIPGQVSVSTDTSITATFNNLPVGIYSINIQLDEMYAYISDTTKQILIVTTNTPTSNQPVVSYAGGAALKLTGTGFDEHYSKVTLCGFVCPIISATYTELTCEAPKLVTNSILNQFTAVKQASRYIKASEVTIISDSQNMGYNVFDLLQSTYYISNAASNCYVQLDFGSDRVLKLHQLRYLPRIDQAAIYLKGALFQYTLDGATWITLIEVTQTVHTGWNIYVPQSDISGIRGIRLFDVLGSSGSSCQLAEIELKGWVYSSSSNQYNVPINCNAIVTVNGQTINTITNAATYSSSNIPIVNTVTPQTGVFIESTDITIIGTGFVSDQTTVTIDGIECSIESVTSTQIKCKTGIKDLSKTQLNGVFQVRVNGNLAINNQQFIYATKWSDIRTWGGYEYPGEGDSVVVNSGQTLIIDVHTPKLMSLLVEGTLTFSDELDTSLDAHYIMIREGKFLIGTETRQHLHKVQITLYGQESDTQMPEMGNKVLGCHQCELIIHGEERTPTWTLLSHTVESGSNQITVDDPVDWRVGEQIVITSSQVEHTQSETRIIINISNDKKTLTLDSPLTYQHYSEIETYGTDKFPMKVEVGLLTRNIVIQGEQSDQKHGYHLMIHGRAEKGAIGKIQYAEFKYGGQPRILGRYPVHFHLNGEVDDSYVIGNSIHDCYARCLTIHGVHYLKVQKNVCFNTFGHAIFLEDGIETNNVIEDNLVASTRQSWIMLQTDITVATYWITNPLNILRRNRSGGSEWYGIWYEIKPNPDGPSATSDICPIGLNILECDDNWSHSNGRFGLRIYQLAPRQIPCKSETNWKNDQPFLDNPSIQAVFSNFYTWKNNECGILAEELGNVLFQNIMIADSKFAGMQSHKGNWSDEGAVLDNALIVGKSFGNSNPDEYYDGARALVVPRTNGFLAKNIKIYNFGSNTALIESCSVCWNMKMWVTGGKNTQFKNIQIFNSDNAKRIYWQDHRREIFWDLDGSISGVDGGAYIIPYKKHINGIEGCTTHSDDYWDNSIICAMNQVTIRDVLINNPTPIPDFTGVDMKLYRLNSQNINLKMDPTIDESLYIQPETMKVIVKSLDVISSFASVFATGYTYNVHFKFGASDPLSMGIFASPYFTPNDKGIILRFNYSSERETFDVYRHIGPFFPNAYTEQTTIPDTNTCNQGDWFNDRTNKLFFICLSGKNKKKYEYVEVRGVQCRKECDSLGDVLQEDEYRLWSEASTWVDNKVPVEGDSPVIQAAYKVILDVDPPKLANLTVLGTLIFDETRASTTLQAERIWVRSGKILAGNQTNPFPGKINIILNGQFGENALQIDGSIDAGNKVLAVTKGLELYSTPPGTVWTRLADFADSGTTQITVIECTDWKIGDEIVFSPSGSDPEQREKRTIKSLNGCTITLDQPLAYSHYGSPSVTIKKDFGQLDMRTVVGHLTRKIKIEGGPSVDGLGCRVLIYYFNEPELNIPRKGYAILQGVEFNNCGQYDTERGGLDFKNLNSELIKTPSEVIGCSFHDTSGMLLTIQNSQYITVKNNIFYTGIKALVEINDSQFIKFQNNALIYVKKRILGDSKIANWAALGNFVYSDNTRMIRENLDVSGNVGSASQNSGFFVMSSSCEDAYQSSFYNNECSGSIMSCFGVRQSDYSCDYVQGLSAFHSGIGIMFAVNSAESKLEYSITAENDVGVVLSRGTDSIQENKMTFSNSYVTAYARPDCPKCYQLNPQCRQTYGMRMGTVSKKAFPPISKKESNQFDSLCEIQRVDLQVYINKVEFNNFRIKYDIPQCSENAVFRQNHKAHDMTGQHYLVNSPCTNCEFDALLYQLIDSDISKLGWFGGCGSFVCTGLKNVLIEDQTGDFFGQVGQAISNNTYFGPNVTNCVRKDSWNGYWCPNRGITVLMFMSVAPDYSTRLYSPIHLTDGLFYNEINSFFEWMWNGPEPLNTRESKFVALVSVNSIINMTNAGNNPSESEYWLSKRYESGSPDDYVILKWQFSENQIIQVSNNNKVIQPGITVINKHYDLLTMTQICGANNYFYENRTIHFVVNGQLDCKVRVSLKNTLRISTRLEITSNEFFGNKFLQYAAAQLGGDPYNYFIIGTKKSARRFLVENESNIVTVDWGIVHNAEIGTAAALESETYLATFASKLESFIPPPEIGTVIGQETTLQVITKTNYTSTEAISINESNTPTNSNTPSNSNNPQTQNNTQNPNPIEDNDELVEVVDEGVNQQSSNENINSGSIQKSVKNSQSDSPTVVIVVSVICSVVGICLIIAGILFYKKFKVLQLAAQRAQKIDNEFSKINITEQPLQTQQNNEQ